MQGVLCEGVPLIAGNSCPLARRVSPPRGGGSMKGEFMRTDGQGEQANDLRQRGAGERDEGGRRI